MPVALITGASRGLGRAIALSLRDRGWSMVIDARGAAALAAVAAEIPTARAIVGDVTDSWHRAALADAVESFGGLHLLVNNASHLGPSPQPQLADYPLAELADVYRVNVTAPLALIQQVLPALLASGGTIVNVSSDAAVEAYAGWGGYGSSKAALDQLTAILGAEQPTVRVYSFDPGDMRTEMHQRAFPGEDISDRPEPELVVPSFLQLLEARPESGRYRASDLALPALR
jgi:NAD(P)-dependent dehydrogenase (short-subunit alcohol dehydrogenase family)